MAQNLFPIQTEGPISDHNPRKAALMLHAMSLSDREWLLNSVDPGHASELRALVGELEELGIPKDPSILEDLEWKAIPKNVAAIGPVEDPWDTLSSAHPDQVWDVLKDESTGFITRVLGMHAWPWAGDLMERLGPVQRLGVFPAASSNSYGALLPGDAHRGEALRKHMVAGIVSRLSRISPRESHPEKRSWMAKAAARFKRSEP